MAGFAGERNGLVGSAKSRLMSQRHAVDWLFSQFANS
jgi:hypothetical protein